jgi:hypothetical protein
MFFLLYFISFVVISSYTLAHTLISEFDSIPLLCFYIACRQTNKWLLVTSCTAHIAVALDLITKRLKQDQYKRLQQVLWDCVT